MEKIKRFLKNWLELTRVLEQVLVDNLAATVPWLAPVVPAYMVFANMQSALGFPVWAALVSALAVELLGLSTVTTAVQLWDYNDRRRKSDGKAPAWTAIIAVVFYLVVVIVVNAVLDGSGVVERVAKALLSTLGVVAAVILAIRAQHTRRLADIAAERAERKAEKAKIVPEVAEIVAKLPEKRGKKLDMRGDWRRMPEEDRMLIANMPASEVATRYVVSERTARSWRAKARMNGNGRKA